MNCLSVKVIIIILAMDGLLVLIVDFQLQEKSQLIILMGILG
jgi:hypothetical protein